MQPYYVLFLIVVSAGILFLFICDSFALFLGFQSGSTQVAVLIQLSFVSIFNRGCWSWPLLSRWFRRRFLSLNTWAFSRPQFKRRRRSRLHCPGVNCRRKLTFLAVLQVFKFIGTCVTTFCVFIDPCNELFAIFTRNQVWNRRIAIATVLSSIVNALLPRIIWLCTIRSG